MIRLLKNRYSKIKESARQFAKTKNVTELSYSFWWIFQPIIFVSAILNLLTVHVLSVFDNSPVLLWNTIAYALVLPMWFMVLLFGFGKYFFYARIMEMHYINKGVSFLLNRLDMLWWRKYRKQSPVTEALFKMQQKAESKKSKLSKSQRRLVQVCAVAGLVILLVFFQFDRFEALIMSWQETAEIIEYNENDFGRIFDGTQKKIGESIEP